MKAGAQEREQGDEEGAAHGPSLPDGLGRVYLRVVRPEDYDFELPQAQIAQRPAATRGAARMLVLGSPGQHVDASAAELAERVADALVVVNDSAVVPARVHADREGDGKSFELLVCDPREGVATGDSIRAWVRGAKRLREGETLSVAGARGPLRLCLRGRDDIDPRARVFEVVEGSLLDVLRERGELPLPPYIQRPDGVDAEDQRRYQSVFASALGSVAAPTAGLHFDEESLARIDPVRITLHVGPGTFLPMEAEDVRDHKVGRERFEISEAAAGRIEAARAEGRPIMAVGTTVTRTLESVGLANEGRIVPGQGATELVISPGYRFRVVERLLTNFHLPRSSLLMLTCTFGGRERVLDGYRHAVRSGYRFYSYGDCMLLTPDPAA